MGSITDLLNFRANDLFPDEEVDWGCEGNTESLVADPNAGKSYYMSGDKKFYCEYDSRTDLEEAIKLKRASLKRSIEVYMEEVQY